MPTYQYRCKSCSHEFEESHSMMAEPLKICPSCSQPTLARMMSGGTGLIFKGSGFYLTDYKKESSKVETKKTEEKKIQTPSESAATTPSKPESDKTTSKKGEG